MIEIGSTTNEFDVMSNPEKDTKVVLGPFAIHQKIGSGGMGLVWRAVHLPTGTAVAVKTLLEAAQTNIDAFRREIKAAAKLAHPNIIALYDFGVTTTDHGSDLPIGTPWLAMELADHSLVGFAGVDHFVVLRRLCLDILAALSHSHSRKIIHRDLKPGNVLVATERGRLVFKLTDFGIAHARGESTSTREVFASAAGTPWYMAPEQIESRWRDYGPWTDLYALGCMIWELSTGETPFQGKTPLDVARAQLMDELPAFKPRFAVPEGFETWLKTLLAKPAASRFQRAADALFALESLAGNDESGAATTREFLTPEAKDTLEYVDVDPTLITYGTLDFVGDISPSNLGTISSAHDFSSPPIAEDWREVQSIAPRPRGVGIGLLSYREIPVVGREAERDRLWEELRLAASERIPRVVLVRSPSGGGKTSLLAWMDQRVHETGAASVTWMTHRSDDSSDNGLSGTLQRYMVCTGLSVERAEARIRRELEHFVPASEIPYDAAVLSALMFGSNVTRFTSTLERFTAMLRLVRAHASTRPFVLLIDDAHHGFEALQLAKAVITSGSEVPLLIVVAVQDDALDVDEHVRAQIDDIAYDPRVTDIALSRLTDSDQHDLLSQLIDLDPIFEDELIEASHGQPVYSIQLLQAWIEAGILHQVDGRFRPRNVTAFPKGVPQILVDRYAKAPEVANLLKIAALVAEVVPLEIWNEIQSAFLIPRSPLGLSQAIEPHPSGFAFINSLVRQAFVSLAHSDGSAPLLHSVIADIYTTRPGIHERQREAQHRIQANQPEKAIAPALEVIQNFISERRTAEAQAWVQMARVAVSEAEVPAGDPRLIALWRHRAELAYASGALGEALDSAKHIVDTSNIPDDLTHACRLMALSHLRRGQSEEAIFWAQRSLECAQDVTTSTLRGDAHRTLGWVHLRGGSLEQAARSMKSAAEEYRLGGRSDHEGLAALGACEALRWLDRLDESQEWLDRALSLVSPEHHHGPWGELQMMAGVVAESQGRIEESRIHLVQAVEALRVTGNPVYHIAYICLSLVETRFGDASQAQRRLIKIVTDTEEAAPMFAHLARIGLAYVAAIQHSALSWDKWYEAVRLRAVRLRNIDMARYLVHAADEWNRVADTRRQRESLELAHRLCGVAENGANRLSAQIQAQLEAL